jgi:hypothetical protein
MAATLASDDDFRVDRRELDRSCDRDPSGHCAWQDMRHSDAIQHCYKTCGDQKYKSCQPTYIEKDYQCACRND